MQHLAPRHRITHARLQTLLLGHPERPKQILQDDQQAPWKNRTLEPKSPMSSTSRS